MYSAYSAILWISIRPTKDNVLVIIYSIQYFS